MKLFQPSRRRTLLAIAIGVSVLSVLWIAARPPAAGEGEVDVTEPKRLLNVSTTPVEIAEEYAIEDVYLGELEAVRRSPLGFELSGTVKRVAVDDGDRVAAGQVLAELDTARLLATRRQQQALLDEALANAKLAESTLARMEPLAPSGAVSRQSLDDARQANIVASAVVARAEAVLQRIDVDLAKSSILAPYAGSITMRSVDEGAVVTPGQVVLEVIEDSALEARFGIKPEAAARLEVGSTAWIRMSNSEQRISARVKRVLPHQDRRTRTVDVVLAIEGVDELFPGDLVEWAISSKVETEGAWLPRTALTGSARGLWAAYVAIPTSAGQNLSSEEEPVFRLDRRELEVLHLEGGKAFVRGALRPGEAVVAAGLHRLVPGQLVVMSEASPAIALR